MDTIFYDVQIRSVICINGLLAEYLTKGVIAENLIAEKAAEENLVKDLDTGADDYVSKPFLPRELVARIKTILRRTDSDTGETSATVGEMVMGPASRSVTIALVSFLFYRANRAVIST